MMTEGMLKFLIKEGLFKGFNSISVAAGDVAIGVLAVILQVTFGLRASSLVRTMAPTASVTVDQAKKPVTCKLIDLSEDASDDED